MRYVTITGSRFYNNGIGIVPNALDSEKFPPAEDNVIRGNEIFWNNFNFHRGAPFKPKASGVVPLVPVGTGVLLLGGRRNLVEDNRSTATTPSAWRRSQGFLAQENPQAQALVGNVVRDNAFGLRRHGPQRPRPGLRRQRHRQLLRRQHGRRGHAARPTARRSPRARSPAPTRSAARRRTRCWR